MFASTRFVMPAGCGAVKARLKVLREKAFPLDEAEKEAVFSLEDAEEFLAMELLLHDPQNPEKTRTAEEHWGLGSEAQALCRLVGYQKMAMMMVAEMINPESKPSKRSWTWAEVEAYVKDRREAAGLSRDLE